MVTAVQSTVGFEPVVIEHWQNYLHTPFNASRDDSRIEAVTVRRAGLHDSDALIRHLATYPELSFTHRWEAGAIRRELLQGSGTIAVAEAGGELVGVGVAGIHGMRGIVHHIGVAPSHREEGIGRQIMRELLSGLESSGVRRVHVFVPDDNCPCRAFLESIGFAPQSGERLLQRDLVSNEHLNLSPRRELAGSIIRPATIDDLAAVLATLAPVPELAFQPWECDLLHSQLREPSNLTFYVAQDQEGNYVGALIGGHNGIRGTVNHIWVAEDHRKSGIARMMLDEALEQFERSGVKRLHIMLTAGNEVGYGFWSRVHFKEIPGETFLERDL